MFGGEEVSIQVLSLRVKMGRVSRLSPNKKIMKYCKKHPEVINGVVAEDNFCYQCGEKLIEREKCENCGRELTPKFDKFCPECGVEVK